MASFWFHLVFIIAFLSSSPLLSLCSKLDSKVSSSGFEEISPEIAPLLPSPGGVLPTPTISSVPTIPANPSPPNPDDLIAFGPAFSPIGSMQASSPAPRNTIWSSKFASFAGLAAHGIVQLLRL